MRRPVRLLLIAVPLALTALAGPIATSADTSASHSGRFGVHYLADSEEYPGVRCAYNSLNVIQVVRVRDPFVFARDRNADRVDSQWVSWKFRVKERTAGGGSWSTAATSDTEWRLATDAQVANFSPMRKSFAGNAGKEYRVAVIIRWYGVDGTTVVGRAVHRADWYAWVGVPSFEDLCPGGIF